MNNLTLWEQNLLKAHRDLVLEKDTKELAPQQANEYQ